MIFIPYDFISVGLLSKRVMMLQRFVWELSPENSGFQLSSLLYMSKKVEERSKSQGYGLHSREEG